ncbi:MAG: phospholipase [Bacteroidales bacterium]
MQILLIALLLLGVVAAVAGFFYHRSIARKIATGEISEAPAIGEVEEECCGAHSTCEKDSLLTAVSKEIVYYDDEELDRFIGKDPQEYSSDAVEEFREILYTLLEEEVAGWCRSLQLRGVELPTVIKDEVLLIVGERRFHA